MERTFDKASLVFSTYILNCASRIIAVTYVNTEHRLYVVDNYANNFGEDKSTVIVRCNVNSPVASHITPKILCKRVLCISIVKACIRILLTLMHATGSIMFRACVQGCRLCFLQIENLLVQNFPQLLTRKHMREIGCLKRKHLLYGQSANSAAMRINLATHPPHAHFHWLLRDCTVKRHVTPVEQKTKVPIRSDSEYQCPTFAQYARNDNNSARLPTACDSKRKLKKKKKGTLCNPFPASGHSQ